MNFKIIVAMDKNRVIGKGNQIPWHISEDLAYFKKITMGHTVIMGRKTYFSIGKALPGRKNVVLSRDKSLSLNDAIVVHNLFGLAEPEAFVIGGASIFEQALDMADTLYITHIDAEFDGDIKFPEINWDLWTLVSCKDQMSSAGYKLSFCVYKRL